MARDRKDRSVSWFMEHLGGSLLRLAKVENVVHWQAAQTVLGFPKQIPDGLLDVTFPDKDTPDPFLIEIETYPEQDTPTQILRDLAMVLLTRGVIPDILLLVLCPKGNLEITPDQMAASARGLTEMRLKIHVVNLWTVPAADLLAAGDVGLVPWVPLAQYEGSPEALLRECRERIEEQAKPTEKDNLLAVTRVMAAARYNDPELLSLLGGQIMSFEKAILGTPWGQRLIETKAREVAQQLAEKTTQEKVREKVRTVILSLLQQRFGSLPQDLVEQLRTIQEQPKLDSLVGVAALCPDLEAFRTALREQ